MGISDVVAEDIQQLLTQCIFINDESVVKPSIPSNESSTRSFSRRNRVYSLRHFLLENYPFLLKTVGESSSVVHNRGAVVLDVAGGRGDLSWILRNVDGVDSIVADPRVPNHKRLVKSVQFLLDHPDEAKVRSMEGVPTYQPLAALIPRLLEHHEISSTDTNARVNLISPRNVRLHVDDALVSALRAVISSESGLLAWDEYWNKEKQRIGSNNTYYGGTTPRNGDKSAEDVRNTQIDDPKIALDTFLSLDLIVGFHPDQATEATIDLAMLLNVPCAIVPCCVFPSEFPDRKINGNKVRTYIEFMEYLKTKHTNLRQGQLSFVESDETSKKSVVLYTLKEDLPRSEKSHGGRDS